MIHVFEDSLWALGDKSIKIPLIPTPVAKETPETTETEDDTKELCETEQLSELKLEDKTDEDQPRRVDDELEEEDQPVDSELDHEKLLMDSFLTAAKFKSKEFKLPVIVSTFMKGMQSCW